MLTYTTRRTTLWKKLKKEGWDIPAAPRGYIILRDSRLSDQARDLFEMWTRGHYEYDLVVRKLRKLERPVPGISSGKTRIAGMIGYQETEEPAQSQPRESHINAVVPGESKKKWMW